MLKTSLFIGFAACAAMAATTLGAGQPTEFVHPNSGVRITYPAHLFPAEWTTPHTAVFSNTEASLRLESRRVESLDEVKRDYLRRLDISGHVEMLEGSGTLVIWATRDDDLIYARYELIDEMAQGFELVYPADTRAYYRTVLSDIEASFAPAGPPPTGLAAAPGQASSRVN